MTQSRGQFEFKGNTLTGMIVLVLGLLAVFFVARGIFWILSQLAVFFLIGTLILDYKVIVNYGKWIGDLFKRNIWYGVAASALSLIGYPVLAVFLFFRAYMSWRLKRVQKEAEAQRSGEYIEYEEIDSKIEKRIELPPIEKQERPAEKRSDYDQLFD